MKKLLAVLTIALCLCNLSFAGGEPYIATAYALRGRTASGIKVRRGIVAADPRRHRLGTYIHVNAGKYSGRYLVADTGGRIIGNRLDIWMESNNEARAFGKRKVFVRRIN